MLLAGVAISYLVPGPMVRREIVALADEVTGGHWRERETISRMSAVIARAEQAARGEKVEYRGRLVDPRYRFRTSTIVEALDITESRDARLRLPASGVTRPQAGNGSPPLAWPARRCRRRLSCDISRVFAVAAAALGTAEASAAELGNDDVLPVRLSQVPPVVWWQSLRISLRPPRRPRPGGSLMGGSGKGRRDGRPTIEGCASRPLASCMDEPPSAWRAPAYGRDRDTARLPNLRPTHAAQGSGLRPA